jgi:hypothetical protein
MQLTDICPGQTLAGVEPNQNVSVVAAVPLSEASIRLVYQTPDGTLKDRLLGRADEAEILGRHRTPLRLRWRRRRLPTGL